nr:sigma-54 dependent transcriptional regulator [Rhodoferax koreense]
MGLPPVASRTVPEADGHFGLLWGRSAPMRRVYEQITRVSDTAVTVFVTGESGTGKELVARTVHDLSRRRGQPFLAVNCGAISPHLMESEIFGHEKGSFTGAERQHQGFFERASGGTLFLDEVTEMPLDLQVKLLRVLETGSFMRVGATQQQQADVRLIAASNRDPLQAVATGGLREDLLYRLNVFPIHMPPLRERAEDIALLATHFLAEIARREGLTKRFAPVALERLADYRWPGNVRELRNIVQRAYVMAQDEIVFDECLPVGQAWREAPRAGRGVATALTFRIGTPLAEVERQLILATLEHYGRHKERTAAALGLSLKTLYNRLKEYSSTPARDEFGLDISGFDQLP